MRKRIVIEQPAEPAAKSGEGWIDVERIATVEVTSENPHFPVESVFGSADSPGWRAAGYGEQRLCILFDQPVSIRHIQLSFEEADCERTQEFTLRWRAASNGLATEIVRQQWNFSPFGSTTEIERYTVDLKDVSALELAIRPDLHRQEAIATLASWRVG